MDLTGLGLTLSGTGSILSGLFGLGSSMSAQAQKEKNRKKALNEAETAYQQGKQDISKWQSARGSILDDDAKQQYKDLVTNTDWDSVGQIDFDKDSYNIDDYRKANEGSIMTGVTNATKGSGAAAGSSWGSGALGNIASAAAQKQEELDTAARQAMNEDRNFDYSVAKDSASQKLSALQNKLNTLGTAYASDTQGIDDMYGSIMSLNQSNAANKVNALLA